MQFYRKHGFGVVAIHTGAMSKVRALKPHVPLVDENGVVLYDFLELESDSLRLNRKGIPKRAEF
jgi:hypothetical protein